MKVLDYKGKNRGSIIHCRALIFALDGEGIIGCEGKDHPIKAGENYHFAKAGLHSVKAAKLFRIALLLTLE